MRPVHGGYGRNGRRPWHRYGLRRLTHKLPPSRKKSPKKRLHRDLTRKKRFVRKTLSPTPIWAFGPFLHITDKSDGRFPFFFSNRSVCVRSPPCRALGGHPGRSGAQGRKGVLKPISRIGMSKPDEAGRGRWKKGRRPKPMTGFMRIGGITISGRTSSALRPACAVTHSLGHG